MTGRVLEALAARLLGTEGFLVGINPAFAQVIARSENNLFEVRTLASLREAIELCQNRRR